MVWILDRYWIEDIDVNCSVDGDLATVWGLFTEDLAHGGQEPERVRVRYSMKLRRIDELGQTVRNHRDIQEFAEDRFHVRKPAQDA